ncbi:hypothetical protein [Ochrobactrum sp. EDr1-4]|uniref:hypothetical protein n=1 Tax=Ochrobactrum sp. EDr1-4 TaxID=3368622 RepID=UPI003BA197BE
MHERPSSEGFNLPTAYKSHDKKLNQKVVLATLFASASVAAILGAQIVGLV